MAKKKKVKLKLKTHRGARKRFKISSTGKIRRMHSGHRHLLGTKAPKRGRRMRKAVAVHPADVPNVRKMFPYGL